MGLAVIVGGVVVLMFPSGQSTSSPPTVVVVASPQSGLKAVPISFAQTVRGTIEHTPVVTRGGRAGKGRVAVQIKKPKP